MIPAGKDERRFCVLDVDPRCAQNHDYFREMDEEMANGGRQALLHDLLSFDLSSVNLRAIPNTDALLEQKLRSLDPIEGWWFERLKEGAPLRGGTDWPEQVASNQLFDDYIASADRIGVRRKAEETSFGIKLKKLGGDALKAGVKVWATVEGVEKRVNGYRLPSLRECRARFETEIGHAIQWDGSDLSDLAARSHPRSDGVSL